MILRKVYQIVKLLISYALVFEEGKILLKKTEQQQEGKGNVTSLSIDHNFGRSG